MNKKEQMKQALELLEQNALPSEEQKDRMLNRVLAECKEEPVSRFECIKQIVITYPWRVAFAVSAVQAIALTLLFGTEYTNLFLAFIGG